jgi:calpain-15
LLIENAYSKVYGSYERIEGGNPDMALRDLTGAPYENKEDGTADELWDYIWENY